MKGLLFRPSGNWQQARYCASTGSTKEYWRSTVNCTGAVLSGLGAITPFSTDLQYWRSIANKVLGQYWWAVLHLLMLLYIFVLNIFFPKVFFQNFFSKIFFSQNWFSKNQYSAYHIFYNTDAKRGCFVSLNGEAWRVDRLEKKMKKKIWKKMLKKKIEEKIFKKFKKKMEKKFGKKCGKKHFGKKNFKTKILITKMYININKCNSVAVLGANTAPVLRQYWRCTGAVLVASTV